MKATVPWPSTVSCLCPHHKGNRQLRSPQSPWHRILVGSLKSTICFWG